MPLSKNGLVPDYKSTSYIHKAPNGQDIVVRIKMTGKRLQINGDYHMANLEANKKFGTNFSDGSQMEDGYVWHHMDDFEIDANGNAWCSFQFVKNEAHTKVPGMTHSGSVAQWKAYYINEATAQNLQNPKLFYKN